MAEGYAEHPEGSSPIAKVLRCKTQARVIRRRFLCVIVNAKSQDEGYSIETQTQVCRSLQDPPAIGNQAYKSELPNSWHIHNVFHVSLLKRWIEQRYRTIEASPQPDLDLDIDQPTEYEVEKIIRKRRVMKKNGRFSHWEYLTAWAGYLIEEATWEPESNFTNAAVLEQNLREDQPTKVNPKRL